MSTTVDRPGSERSEVTTTSRQDLITALLGSMMTLGGFIDGFAHRNLDTPETFFTPWHAILYSGFLLVVLWTAGIVGRTGGDKAVRERIPRGYEITIAGIAVFALGGVGDLIWHTVFGIEVSVDALLSPTHIMLLLGAILILAGPLRARWSDPDYRPRTIVEFGAPIVAIAAIASELGFFFQYIDGFSNRFLIASYEPGLETGYFEVVAGLSSMLVTTAILMGALLVLMQRWTLPAGAAFLVFAVFGLLMELLEGYDFPQEVIAPLVGGGAAEVMLARLRARPRSLPALRLLTFLVPLVMWTAHMVVFEAYSTINWPPSIWGGSLVFAGLAGLGLGLLAFPGGQDRPPQLAV